MKTYVEQIYSHLDFLQSNGLDVKSLEFERVVRCRATGQTQGRGELAYCCSRNQMQKGYVGLVTWCRSLSGEKHTFKTYGLSQSGKGEDGLIAHIDPSVSVDRNQRHEEAARRAYGFWQNSSPFGSSCYLDRKAVGHYGIRFRSSEKYGNVAVVPMRDESGRLWSYQLLNPDGSKRFPEGARTEGLFHILNPLTDGSPIGIAESYATAATCFELSNIPTVCAFYSENILATAQSIRKLHPKSPIFLFADNDRHLEHREIKNKGVCSATEAMKGVDGCVAMAEPEFGDLEASKEASDWNDLVRLKGIEVAQALILKKTSACFKTI